MEGGAAADILKSQTSGAEASLGPHAAVTGPGSRPALLGVRQGSRTVLVELADIDWVEADGDYARLHVKEKIHLVTEPLRDLEQLLDPARFLRIHRSVIVNLTRARELRRDPDGGGTLLLDCGVQLRVARNRWNGLQRALGLA